MALNEQDVVRIARLARIELTSEQREQTKNELNGLLHLIERLQSVDTTGVEPLAQPLSAHEDVVLRLRPDVVRDPGSLAQRDAMLSNAPALAEGLFLVPKVIE
jgi:aspartyl-tRNA(Asn)/glutamyl-tRNA(Gln) amidotransferase subunit C